MNQSIGRERSLGGVARRHGQRQRAAYATICVLIVWCFPKAADAQSSFCSSAQCSQPGIMCGATSICQLSVCAETCNNILDNPSGCVEELNYACVELKSSTNRVPLIRYVNGRGQHFYTTNFSELGTGAAGYALEGIAGFLYSAPTSDAVLPVYRYRNFITGTHFYTTDFSELGNGGFGYVTEGIIGYAAAIKPRLGGNSEINLYRYFNPGNGDHFYTTDYGELGPGGLGWHFEKVQCSVFASANL